MPRGVWSASVGGGPAPVTTFTTATSFQNVTYRDVTIYVTSTAAITAVAVGPATGSTVSLATAVPANATFPLRVPSGHWSRITPTGPLPGLWLVHRHPS